MRDANDVVLGRLMMMGTLGPTPGRADAVWIITSTKHIVALRFDGSFSPSNFQWSGPNCTGTPVLNSNFTVTNGIYGKFVAATAAGNLYVPASAPASTMIAMTTSTTGQSIENLQGCSASAASAYTWALTPTTRAAIGLPATIAGPLRLP